MSGYDDKSPVILCYMGWEELAENQRQLLFLCLTEVDFIAMPKVLVVEHHTFHRREWDSQRRIAFFREEPTLDLQVALTA